MELKFTVRFEVDEDCGNKLGEKFSEFWGGASLEYALSLNGGALEQGYPQLLPYAERLGMMMTGDYRQPTFSLPEKEELVPFLTQNLQVTRTTSLYGEEDRRELPTFQIIPELALALMAQGEGRH